MAVEAYGTARNTLFMIKSTECGPYQGDQGIDASNPTTIPPLGTINADGDPTTENDNLETTKGANFLRSEAVMGAFQFIEGKSAISIQVDNEKFDFQDLNSAVYKREFFKGGETMTGTIELGERSGEMYWMGAALGLWHSTTLQYKIAPQYRHFEIWCAVNPDILDTTFTKCDVLYKLVNVTLDNANATFENPIKHSIPFSFSDIRIFVDYEDDLADAKGVSPGGLNGQTLYLTQEFAGATAGGLDTDDLLYLSSAVGPTNAPNGDGAHTRFLIELDILDTALDGSNNGSLKVIVKGKDPMGRRQTEEFFIADVDAVIPAVGSNKIELLTNTYWDGPEFSVTMQTKNTFVPATPTVPIFNSVSAQTIKVYSVDWKSQEGVPIVEV